MRAQGLFLFVFACFNCLLPLTQAVPFPFWNAFLKCLQSVQKVPYVPQQKWQGLKRCSKQTCHHWMSAVRSHKHLTQTGRMEKVSESQETNWEERPAWFWGTKKPRWKGWKKNLFILQTQESRGGRTDTLLACWTLSLSVCMHACVEKAVLSSTLSLALTKILLVYENSK